MATQETNPGFSAAASAARTLHWKERAIAAEDALVIERSRSNALGLYVAKLEERLVARNPTPWIVLVLALLGVVTAAVACVR